jgi:RimJ/RimL family protein N-acetyltransferase
MQIETNRLFLRSWVEKDVDDAYCVFGDPQVCFFTGGALSPERMQTFVKARMESQDRAPCIQPLVERSTVVGVAGLQPLAGGPDPEIGWVLAKKAWGKGYATEIGDAVLKHALLVLGLARILATIDKRNSRSVLVANRLGMRFERILQIHKRDMLLYEARLQPGA